jgi:hypothetical protein
MKADANMQKLRKLIVVLLPITLALGSCSATILSSGGVTVDGSVNFDINSFAYSPASITVKQGSSVYAVSVAIPPQGRTGQTGTFTISNVPPGTYIIIVNFTSTSGSLGISYSMTGSSSSPSIGLVSAPNGQNWDWTATMTGLDIQSNTTIDFNVSALLQ